MSSNGEKYTAHAWGTPFPFNEPGRPTSCHRQRCRRCGALAVRCGGSGAGRSATLLLEGQPTSCVTVPVEVLAADEPPGAESVPTEPVSSAVEALSDAPSWWSPCVEGKLRKWLWVALRDDSPGQLEAALRTYSWGAAWSSREHPGRVGWELGKLFVRLRLALWSGSKGKGPGGKRRGLLHAAACNVSGVPEGGAVCCLERLLDLHPPDREELWQLRIAVRDARCLGRDEAVSLLSPHMARLEAAETATAAVEKTDSVSRCIVPRGDHSTL